jgi:hypothetical protein
MIPKNYRSYSSIYVERQLYQCIIRYQARQMYSSIQSLSQH